MNWDSLSRTELKAGMPRLSLRFRPAFALLFFLLMSTSQACCPGFRGRGGEMLCWQQLPYHRDIGRGLNFCPAVIPRSVRAARRLAWTCLEGGEEEENAERPHSFVDIKGRAGRELDGLKEATRYVNAGRRTEEFSTDALGRSIVNVPVFRASTITFPTLQSLGAPKKTYGIEGVLNGLFYGRYGTLTQRSLEDAYAHLQGGFKACAMSTPAAASIASILAFARYGSSVIFSENVRKDVGFFCKVGLARLGINPIAVAHGDEGASLVAALQSTPRASVVYVEGPSPPYFIVPNLQDICARAHAAGALVIFDNSWAGCVYYDPFALGADIVVSDGSTLAGDPYESLGLVASTQAVWQKLMLSCKKWGGVASPDLSYMTLRGIRTLPLRAEARDRTARALAAYLQKRSDVIERVCHPALLSHPTHREWSQGGYTGAGGMFSFVLKEAVRSDRHLAAMMDHMKVFKISNAVGGHVCCMWPLSLDLSYVGAGNTRDAVAGLVLVYAGHDGDDAAIGDLEAALNRLSSV